jgi:hypothetical protein
MLLRHDVEEVFGILINDFFSLASIWLCNKRFLQLNVVSSAVQWGIWNNRNSIIFNRKFWLNMKQVWPSGAVISEELKGSLQRPALAPGGWFLTAPLKQVQHPTHADAGLICMPFGWTSSWKTTGIGSSHGGRATVAYLNEHPEEADEIHVVMG